MAATAPTPSEARQTRALAAAIFAKPVAAGRAADKAATAAEPDLAAVQPKPEWARTHIHLSGVKLTAPF